MSQAFKKKFEDRISSLAAAQRACASHEEQMENLFHAIEEFYEAGKVVAQIQQSRAPASKLNPAQTQIVFDVIARLMGALQSFKVTTEKYGTPKAEILIEACEGEMEFVTKSMRLVGIDMQPDVITGAEG